MIELKKYQCEHCMTIFDRSDYARRCEETHILYNEIQILKAIHNKCPPVTQSEGKWPEFIIVGKDNVKDVFIRYKYSGPEEFMEGDPFFDSKF